MATTTDATNATEPEAHEPEAHEPVVYGVSDAAELLDVSEATIYRSIAAGYIKAVRVGPRMWRIGAPEMRRLTGLDNLG